MNPFLVRIAEKRYLSIQLEVHVTIVLIAYTQNISTKTSQEIG